MLRLDAINHAETAKLSLHRRSKDLDVYLDAKIYRHGIAFVVELMRLAL